MTTDYAALGRASLERLHAATGRARQLQLEELEHILGCNAASAYGRRYGFSDIRSVEDYQRRVPLSCHEDYEPYVERLLAGERAQLTCAEPVYYAITSGSTGVPKYVPVTAEDMLVHYNGIYAGVFGMVRE